MRINPNIYLELDDCYQLCMIRNSKTYYSYFDKNVYEIVNGYHWRVSNSNKHYVRTNISPLNGKQRTISMHHLIMNFKPDKVYEIDHINGNGLDNRTSNLRIVTRVQNLYNKCIQSNNSSTIAGVYFDKSRNKYAVEIGYNKKDLYLGRYKSLAECAFVKMLAEKRLYGEYRYTCDDEYKNSLIDKISTTRKLELESYVAKKIGELNV